MGVIRMQRATFLTITVGLIAFAFSVDSYARGRGGFRGGGGARVSGPRGGAVGGYRGSAAVGPYGGSASRFRSGGTVVGPAGGSATRRYGSGSVTTPRGGSIQYGGAAKGRTGPVGGSAGRTVGGVRVTTPGGRTATKFGTAGGAVGPGGRAVGGRTSVGSVSGPRGTAGGVKRSGGAIGPRGAVGGSYRGGVAVGPHGAVAGSRTRAVRTGVGRPGTRYVSRSSLHARGTYVRTGFRHYSCFTRTWYARYPRAWRAARWTAATVWVPATWATVSTYCSYPTTPIYYDYGSTVVYQDNSVYINGEPAATAEQYAQQAEQIAVTGQQAKVDDNEQWQPLGVFAMVQGEEQTSYHIFQLAVNKQGIIRGNYFNALTDTTEPISGSVDSKTQRAAWTIENKKYPVYEAGIANLTKEETTMLVHFSEDNTQQMTLVRLEQKEQENP